MEGDTYEGFIFIVVRGYPFCSFWQEGTLQTEAPLQASLKGKFEVVQKVWVGG